MAALSPSTDYPWLRNYDHGAEVNVVSSEGYTPLILAVGNQLPEIVERAWLLLVPMWK